MFFDSWSDVSRVILVGTLAYASLIFMLRVSGKRTLSKMNAFDFVVTVALGSTLATILLSKDTALAEGVTAFALLVTLQYLVALGSARSRRFGTLVKSEPKLLYFRGRFLHSALLAERVAESEVEAAIRAHGQSSARTVTAVVLETSGEFSVVAGPEDGELLPGQEGRTPKGCVD